MAKTIQNILFLENGTEKALPVKWCICGQCEGAGKSSAYLGAFTSDDMQDMDQDFIDDYFDGQYDRPCHNCSGSGKIQHVDFSRVSPADAKLFRAQEWEIRQCELENAAEIRAGA